MYQGKTFHPRKKGLYECLTCLKQLKQYQEYSIENYISNCPWQLLSKELIDFNFFSISKQRFQNWFNRKIHLLFHTIILSKSINISKHRIANTGVYFYNIHITNNFTKFRKTVNFFALFLLVLVWDENKGQFRAR